MAPVWQSARAFGNCSIQNRCINPDFDQFLGNLWCLDKDFCMAAFEYVYKTFPITRLLSAVTISHKKFTAQACGHISFHSFYTFNIKNTCMFAYVYWRKGSFLNNLHHQQWPKLLMKKKIKFNFRKQCVFLLKKLHRIIYFQGIS